jgi:hypothetical protein
MNEIFTQFPPPHHMYPSDYIHILVTDHVHWIQLPQIPLSVQRCNVLTYLSPFLLHDTSAYKIYLTFITSACKLSFYTLQQKLLTYFSKKVKYNCLHLMILQLSSNLLEEYYTLKSYVPPCIISME